MRWTAYDGRLSDLASDLANPSFMPLVSDNWTSIFDWRGEGELPADEQALLDGIVATAHGNDQRVRFWATPDEPGPTRDALWQALADADVDHVNTDDLAGLRVLLLAESDEHREGSSFQGRSTVWSTGLVRRGGRRNATHRAESTTRFHGAGPTGLLSRLGTQR